MSPIVDDQPPLDEDLTYRIGKINEQIDRFEAHVDLSGRIAGRFAVVGSQLEADRDTLVQVARRMGTVAEEEWRHSADQLRASVEQIEQELGTAWADLEAEVADDIDVYKDAAQRQLETWRGYVDHLRVRTALAGMEARDAFGAVEAAFQAASPELEQALNAADDAFESLKDRARDAVGHLRDATRAAAVALDRMDRRHGSMT